ncbi:hypothetical protein NQZ68_020339 [Dissostichus eleginoides]|nr:hypothetical protein NQZ68_020339 [Dissostichus eleginoides]
MLDNIGAKDISGILFAACLLKSPASFNARIYSPSDGGLRLNTPSEISHFKKIHEQLEPPCCITAAITGFSTDTA